MQRLLRVLIESRRASIVGGVAGAFLGVASVALATEASSPVVQSPTVNGRAYGSASDIITGHSGSPSDWADTQDFTDDGKGNVPAGWIGINARKFRNGNVCEQSGWYYSQYSLNSLTIFANQVACGSGTYYSYGQYQAYNGVGYNTYPSGVSPKLNG